ncbi:MAG: TldD/PmbA family protein [Deferribacteres bacterium]|nr:TldD/PmbA family protein [Deferribacteres bacterium]
MEAQEVAADIVRKALNRGCTAAEVFVKSSQGISVEAKDGRVEAMEVSRGFGLSLKVIRRRKLGFAFMTMPAGIGSCRKEIDRTIDEAVQGSEWTAADEYTGIPDYMPPGDVLVFDEKINSIDEGDVIRDAILLEDSALSYDERIKKVRKAAVSAGAGKTVIVNSKGVNAAYEATYYSAHVTAVATDRDGDSQMGWDYAGSRRLSDIDIKSVGEGASKRALELLGSVRISPVKIPVILAPFVAVEFLEILSASLSAEAVQKQRSFLAGKSGQEVVSPLLDIIDDGTMAWRTGTRPVDDEGVPVANKTLVSGGVLRGFIHNTYTAAKDNTASTGNASRGSFKSLPGIDVTNFYIKPDGGKSGDDMVKSLSRGILILGAMGVHTANPVSGDFSVGISGQWIENGETVYPVKEAVISGNILDMFRKVEGVGNDLRFYGNIGSPSLLIGDMDVSA